MNLFEQLMFIDDYYSTQGVIHLDLEAAMREFLEQELKRKGNVPTPQSQQVALADLMGRIF